MALAGAIIRTRKERERKRNESSEKDDLSEVVYGKDKERESRDGASSVDLRKSPTSLKKSISKSQLLRKSTKLLSQSFDSEVGGGGGDGIFESTESYSGLYIGLILFGMGSVITFVGLGDKGFKTLELKLIGPVLCLCGFACVIFKILQCSFPRLFKGPECFRRHKLKESDRKSNVNGSGSGIQNGHLINNTTVKPNSEIFSPRVTLTSQSSIKTPRPQSTVPNFIEDSTDDEDDFQQGRAHPHTHPYFSPDDSAIRAYHHQYQQQLQLKHKLEQIQRERLELLEKQKQKEENAHSAPGGGHIKTNSAEIVLDPKMLKL